MDDYWYILVPGSVAYALTACPACGAGQGERCQHRGKDRRQPHIERQQVLEAAFSAIEMDSLEHGRLSYVWQAFGLFAMGKHAVADELLTTTMMWDEIAARGEDPRTHCEALLGRV